MREGIRVREITNDEGRRLLQIVRRSSGSVVRWRRAQMVLLSAQGMDVAQIAKVAFTSPDRVRAVLHNFIWHERFTWRDRKSGKMLRRLVRFNLSTGLISIVGNLLLMRLLVGSLRVHYMVANLVSIGACSLLNFVASDRLVFQPEYSTEG